MYIKYSFIYLFSPSPITECSMWMSTARSEFSFDMSTRFSGISLRKSQNDNTQRTMIRFRYRKWMSNSDHKSVDSWKFWVHRTNTMQHTIFRILIKMNLPFIFHFPPSGTCKRNTHAHRHTFLCNHSIWRVHCWQRSVAIKNHQLSFSWRNTQNRHWMRMNPQTQWKPMRISQY